MNIQIPQDLGTLINGVYGMLQQQTNVAARDLYSNIYAPSINLLKLYVAQSFFTFSYICLLGTMGENMAANLKKSLFNNMIKQDIAFYDRSRSGELIDRLL